MGAIIASGQRASSAIRAKGQCLVGVRIPAAFTGTSVSFTECDKEAGTYRAVTKDGNELSFPVAAGDVLKFQYPAFFAGLAFIKIVSGSDEAAQRELTPLFVSL